MKKERVFSFIPSFALLVFSFFFFVSFILTFAFIVGMRNKDH